MDQLTKLATKAPSGAQWVYEIKFDGYRMAARIDRGKVRLLTRTGLDWTRKYPAIAAAFAKLKVTTAYLDGELCGVRPDGVTSFELIQQGGDGLVFFAFDLLELDGEEIARLGQAGGGHGMSEEDAGNRLEALVKAVSDDLWIAVATFEVYAPSAFDAALIEKVNEREVYPAFNVISEALEATTISTLCRIWDRTSDAARIAEIEKLLRKRPDLAGDNGALRRWLGGVEMVEKSEELQALRAIRNMRLAHTHDPNRLDSRLLSGVRKAAIEDERLILEVTVLVIQQLHGLIGSPDSLDYHAEREAWRGRAEAFWKAVRGERR